MATAPGWAAVQARVQDRLDELVASGLEAGAQFAVYAHGELVVDAYAGVAEPATGRPVAPDTPFYSFTTGKGLLATVVHVLAERGQIDYDLRVADVWPEFAQHGKQDITLRHALTHTSAVPALPADTTPEDFADWDRMCAVLAASRPLWTPGAATGYHAWTFGWLVGEVVRRATGRTVSQVLAEEIAAPLGVPGELFFGVPEAYLGRMARLADRNLAAALAAIADALPNLDLVAPPAVRPDAALGNRPGILRADIPATGTVSARAVAKMYAALVGEVDGVRLVSPERLREIAAVAVQGRDWVFEQDCARTLGYAVEADAAMIGWSGSGGSLAGAAPHLGLAIGATKNLLGAGDSDPMEDLRALVLRAATP